MKRELKLTADPIDEAALLAGRSVSGTEGAAVCFLGFVRGLEEGAPIEAIDYEAFEAMAVHQFNLLFDKVEARWPVSSIRLVHRTGRVEVGEASLWVEVLAPHRGEAFEAAEWLIAEMKKTVPIWKKAVC
ncbi:MAG: molybdenum cofactor biosynthesis protein MoaE [Verrucomicrobiota bacterium]